MMLLVKQERAPNYHQLSAIMYRLAKTYKDVVGCSKRVTFDKS